MGISAYSGMLSIITVMDSIRPVRSGKKVRVLAIVGLAVSWFALAAALTIVAGAPLRACACTSPLIASALTNGTSPLRTTTVVSGVNEVSPASDSS